MKKNSTKKALLLSVLSLLLCVSMLIGTTYAWFTDTVTSASNIIKSGTLDVELTYADGKEDPATATFADASEGAIFNYELWEPGYTEVKHLGIANVGTLALKYQMRILANGVVSKLADVIDVYYIDEAEQITSRTQLKDADKLGTLSQVINNFGEKVFGVLLAGESKTVTLALKMQESAGNEYQNLSIGTDFSVQLLATQYTYEEDSFDHLYDEDADFAAQKTPSPMVSEYKTEEITYTAGIGGAEGKMTLDAAYQFQPTETAKQAEQSEYRWHHADFVVSADADVPAESIALAGFYNLWCNGYNGGRWVALTSPEDIAAGEEVRLVHGMGGGSITVAYQELCNYGNDGTGFLCGLKALDAKALAGTTISVELRLYETYPEGECPADHGGHKSKNCETGEYIIAGVTTYTFPAVEVETAEDLADAIANGVSSIALAGNITDVDANSAITVPAGADVTLDLNGHKFAATADKKGNQEIFLVKGNMTVKNGSIELAAENNQAWDAMAAIFDVTAGGALNLEGVKATVGGTDMSFIVHLNNWGAATLNANNCDFYAPYVAVRAFNSGHDMNTVTIKNTDVYGGGRLFWVHNYTAEGKDDSTLTLDIYSNNNTSENAKPIRFGFTDSVYYDLDGNAIA